MPRTEVPEDHSAIADEKPVKNDRSWLYHAGLVASLICLAFFACRALSLHDSLATIAEDALARVPIAVIPYLLASFAAAFAWRYVLMLLGVNIRLSVGIGIFFVTQFGKYLPGNFAHHVGRVTVAKRYGVPIVPVLTSMIVEIGIVVGLVLLFGIPVLARYFKPEPVWFLAASAAAVLIGAGIWSRRQSLVAAREAVVERLANATSMQQWIVPILISAGGILLSASGLLLLDSGFTARLDTSAFVISAFCAAWIAGFLTPGAPAGLGIRELILGEGLAVIVGIERATAAAILLRAVTTITDLLAFGIGLMLLRRLGPAPAQAAKLGH